MNTIVGIGLVIGGTLLSVLGMRGSDSIALELSRSVTGSPIDNSVCLQLGGVGCLVIGLAILWRWLRPAV